MMFFLTGYDFFASCGFADHLRPTDEEIADLKPLYLANEVAIEAEAERRARRLGKTDIHSWAWHVFNQARKAK